mmetsp:Transcript_81298/g.242257  ORF Transcript_81298/g.242257 Transcript_81298/m.242257 type:complete len:215 (-) Transcript_81298:160-804(-)
MMRFMGRPGSAASSQLGPPFATMRSFSLSVSVQPMFTALTRMPWGANSPALLVVRALSAALEAEYAMMNGAPPFAAMELTFTMEPPRTFASIQCFATAWVSRKGARVLMSNCLLNISTVVSIRFPRSVVPAALTRPSTWPPRALMASAAAGITEAGSAMLASTKHAVHPSPESSATAASPLAFVRDMSASFAAPRAFSCLAISRPRPCVPPVTM